MNPGKFHYKGLLEARLDVKDQHGEPIPGAYAPIKELYYSLTPLTGRELFNAQQVQPDVTHKLMCWYDPQIDSSMRIIHNGRALNILTVIGPEGQPFEQTITLMVQESKVPGYSPSMVLDPHFRVVHETGSDQVVTRWTDLSGEYRFTGEELPSFIDDDEEFPYVRFIGEDSLSLQKNLVLDEFTIIAVSRCTAIEPPSPFITLLGLTGGEYEALFGYSSFADQLGGIVYDQSLTTSGAHVHDLINAGWNISAWRYSVRTLSDLLVLAHGTDSDSAIGLPLEATTVKLGGPWIVLDSTTILDIAHLAFFDRALTSDEVQDYCTVVATRLGLA